MPAVDRFGNPIRIGWAPKVLLWLEAANRLTRKDRPEAFEDIASLSGFSLSSVKRKAEAMRAVERAEAKAFLQAHATRDWLSAATSEAPRRVFVSVPTLKGRQKPNPLKVAAE